MDIDEGRVTAIVQRLVRAPSFQTDRFEADPEVQRFLGETVSKETSALGLTAERDAMGDLIVRVGPRTATRRVLLFAYAMTHPRARMTDPLDGRLLDRLDGDGTAQVVGGPWIRGRGAAEQKGPLGAVLEATGLLQRRAHQLHGELIVCVSAAGETGRHDTARAVMDFLGEPPIDFAVVAIATGGAICLANKGRVDAVITVRGKTAHSSTPWAGANAIDGARTILRRLDTVPLSGEHPHLGRPTLTVTSIRSFPDATHTVQDEVRLVVDRRLLPGQDHAAAFDDIVRAVGTLPPFEVDVALGPVNRPAEVAPDSPVVTLLEEGVRAAGGTPRHSYSHGCVDAGFFVERGIPAVMFGAGDPALWHTDDEAVAVPDVVACARALAHATFRHLASDAALTQDRPS